MDEEQQGQLAAVVAEVVAVEGKQQLGGLGVEVEEEEPRRG